MAKGKSGTRKTYVSKGERPSVSRSILNAMRRDRRANPSLDSIFQRMEHRNYILSRPKDRSLKSLYDRYQWEDMVESRARELFEKWGKHGAKWSACVQAVKTDYVSEFENKWRGS